MSRSQGKNRDPLSVGTSVNSTGFYGKMSTRRQADHESGYYEDSADDCYVYRTNTKSSSIVGKRQKVQASEVLYSYDKRSKRQMASPSVKKSDPSAAASIGLYGSNQKVPIVPDTNINTYNFSSNGTNYKMACQTNNNSSKKNIHIKNNNNNNTISINKEIKQKNINNVNSKIGISATNNNHYANSKNNNNNGRQSEHRKVSTIDLNEIVEVPDSDSETEDRNTFTTIPCKSKLKATSSVINKNTIKTMPTFIVSGSSSNSNHSMPNSYEQQASGSKLQAVNNNNCNSNKDDVKKGPGTTGSDNDPSNVNVDLERLQREIEDVTQVHTNCKFLKELKNTYTDYDYNITNYF